MVTYLRQSSSLAYYQRELVFENMDIFSETVVQEMDREDLAIILSPYLAILSEREKEAVSLIIMNRFSYAQAANMMKVRRSAVAEYVHRAKEKWEKVSSFDRFNPRGIRNVSC